MGEIKQTNFRIDQDTADIFRKFCEENGMNQAQGFDHIMQIVEMDRAKAVTPERATEIEEFERYVKGIMGAYLTSIEINNSAEERIKERFESSLVRKDKTIDELREKTEGLQEEKKKALIEKEQAEKEKEALDERMKTWILQMESIKKAAENQEKVNAMLTTQLADATAKLDGYNDLKASEVSLKEEVLELRRDIKEKDVALSRTKEMYDEKLSSIKEMYDEKLSSIKLMEEKYDTLEKKAEDLKKELSDTEKELSNLKMQSENEKKQAEMQLELTAERAAIAKERELGSTIREMDKENARLSLEIERLKEKLEEKNEPVRKIEKKS